MGRVVNPFLGLDPDYAANQELTMRRNDIVVTTALVSQRLLLSYFTAKRTRRINNLACATGSTAAAATPTLCRMALYELNADATLLTLKVATANDTSLYAAANTRYQAPVISSAMLLRGYRYAFTTLVVSATTMPSIAGRNNAIGPINALEPRLAGYISGQTDLPATINNLTVADIAQQLYGEILT